MKPLKGLIAVLLLYLFIPISSFFYFLSYEIINKVDTSSYIRYATNGNYNEDIYFKKALDENISLEDTFISIIGKKDPYDRKQDLFKALLKDERLFRKKISENTEYVSYLEKTNVTIDDLISFMKKLIDLDNLILTASVYLASLLYIFVYYILFKYRKRIYIGAAILYFILVLDSFTAGVLSATLIPYFQKNGDMNYEQFMIFFKSLLPAIREATLTFIIVDTVVQYYVDRKNKLFIYRFKKAYYSLEKALNGINTMRNKNTHFRVTQIDVDFNIIYKLCRMNKGDYYLKQVKSHMEKVGDLYWKDSTPDQIHDMINPIYDNLKKSRVTNDIIASRI